MRERKGRETRVEEKKHKDGRSEEGEWEGKVEELWETGGEPSGGVPNHVGGQV